MNKDIIVLKESIIALVDECNIPYVITLLNGLENIVHEISFESGYETGHHIGISSITGSSCHIIRHLSKGSWKSARNQA